MQSFGVVVVQVLNNLMHTELETFGRWLSETVQNAEKQQVLEKHMILQVNEALEERKNATDAAKEVEKRNKEALEEAKRELEETDRDAAARVAAAENTSKVAKENATRAEQEAEQISLTLVATRTVLKKLMQVHGKGN